MVELRKSVCAANRAIGELGLAPLTWGNASAVDREQGLMAIKPSGVAYDQLQPGHIVVLSLEDGDLVSGMMAPSSDAETHRLLYLSMPEIGGIIHTHSRAATIWAQACRAIPCLGTTHADTFRGEIPVTADLTDREIADDYTPATARSIVAAAKADVPAALVAHHAPFVWGITVEAALENALTLEHVADMALATLFLNPDTGEIPSALRDRHYDRKHGVTATYGQR